MSKGIVIQAYGKSFAGLMKMNLERWYKIYEDYASEPFKIKEVSPFSIIGSPDPTLQKYAEGDRTNTRVKADVLKNFDKICERAYADYFCFDNSSCLLGLLGINDQLYSLIDGEETDFTDDVWNNNDESKSAGCIVPQEVGFCDLFRSQYDLFIETVMRHYDPEHIILIRSHVPRYWSNQGMIAVTSHDTATREFLETLDDYFAHKTGCLVLETPLRFFETVQNSEPFLAEEDLLRVALERDVISLIESKTIQEPMAENAENSGRTSSESGMLADYIAAGGSDTAIMVEYFQRVNYTYDDLVGAFYFVERRRNADNLLASEILANKDGMAYKYTKQLFEKNLSRLRDYDYCLADLSGLQFNDRIYIQINATHYIRITREGFKRIDLTPTTQWDWKRFYNNDCTCDISRIYNALESWETYFERGRNNDVTPFILQFPCSSDFEESLYFIDYCDILDNENYVLSIAGEDKANTVSKLKRSAYIPKVDFRFFFDEKTRIFQISGGLSDQKNYFLSGLYACRPNNLNLYLDDLKYETATTFNGIEVQRVVDPSIEFKLLSDMLSLRLRRRLSEIPIKTSHFATARYYELGFTESYLVVWFGAISTDRDPGMFDLPVPILYSSSLLTALDYMIRKIPGKTPIATMRNGAPFGLRDKEFFEQTFTFPPFEEDEQLNKEVAELISSVDAIGLHIRRGDYVTPKAWWAPWNKEYKFYKSFLEAVWKAPEFKKYNNKHLFIFSDDCDFVKEHSGDIGIDALGENNVTYVSWNHHYNSFRDMHLLSMCKVILFSLGGFSQSAALMGKSVEYLIQGIPGKNFIVYKR